MTARRPIPFRITTALDMADLHGPEVDAALGVPEPTVDLWEEGKLVPTDDQLERLAELTGFAVEYFFRERPPQSEGGAMFLCRRGRGGGCEVIDTRTVAEVVELYGQASLW
ncbi:transcriptional regulator with XRE-family HTH domain [Rhodococcus sp. PvR044]|uniref:helix-turn-helix domain-containing protein n=1 Tax=Rhodococcus sp. PvR044 TaxID=3156402 RepID=UPI003397FB93